MAGDWIKMRVGLTTHPRVLRIAECLLENGEFLNWSGLAYGIGGCPAPDDDQLRAERHAALRVTRYVTVTALLKFWGYANEHAKGDSIGGVWPEDIDEIAGVPGFSSAIEAAGWLEFDHSAGGLTMPNFDEHNTSATERSSTAAERQKRYRERKRIEAETLRAGSDVTRDVTVTPREEKRREEKSKEGERATRLPKDFEPTPEPEAEQGINRVMELANFRDYWKAKAGKEGRKLDWQATWRTWARKAHRNPADVARMTVPSKPGRDPALVKLDEDAKRAAPMPANFRESMTAVTKQLKVGA